MSVVHEMKMNKKRSVIEFTIISVNDYDLV